ncbi:MAG: DUF58 domain-containing protein [Deltaproteobacteria bacterium]|nr:DUF58 domain-containing protein [Candidatus Tharpella aukensis]
MMTHKRRKDFKFSWRRQFDAWLARRRPEISSACRLSHRRLYIIPTITGLFFALVLLLILVGAANYGSSMAFILVFLLIGVGINAIWLTHANLSGLIIEAAASAPVFAGESVAFRLRLENPQARPRPALKWGWLDESQAQVRCQLKSLCGTNITLTKTAARRGWFLAPPLRLGSSWPLGLFYVWTVLRLAQKILVYPQPAQSGVPLPVRALEGGEKSPLAGHGQVSGNDDFVGLRPYRIGDSPGRLDWRALARGGELQAREFHGNTANQLLLDWWQLRETGVEARLSRLCRWVLDAEAASLNYGLRLPGQEIAPGRGPQHRHQVLTALALFDGGG